MSGTAGDAATSGTVGGAGTSGTAREAATNDSAGAAKNGAPGIAFVHGGKHDSRCWRPTMDVIAARTPELPMVAVDLPGRGGATGDMSLAGCVASAVAQINAAGLDRLLLVGHSLAGVTVPLIAAIPRTWVLTTRDRTLPPRVQRRFAANLGVSETVPIATGHNPMVADPEGLADILLSRLQPIRAGRASP